MTTIYDPPTVEPLTAEEEATTRAAVDAFPQDPNAKVIRRLLATLDAARGAPAGVREPGVESLARAIVRAEHPTLPIERMWEHGPTRAGAMWKAEAILAALRADLEGRTPRE